eukprot:867223-Pelagomonas_calceolata.AAC.1
MAGHFIRSIIWGIPGWGFPDLNSGREKLEAMRGVHMWAHSNTLKSIALTVPSFDQAPCMHTPTSGPPNMAGIPGKHAEQILIPGTHVFA